MRRRLLLTVVSAALLAACAAEVADEPVTSPPDALMPVEEVPEDVAGLAVAVGSRTGATDEVLGAIAVELLTAAGADVTADLGVGDSWATREAQLAGLVDLTWERTGTAWLTLLREIGPSADPAQLHEDVAEADREENAIVWLDPAPADTGAALVASPRVIDQEQITSLADLAAAFVERRDGIVICVSRAEEPLDPGGVAAFADAADLRLRPRHVVPVPDDRLLSLVEDGTFCPFALVHRMDPRLDDADVEDLADDLGAFVARNPAPTVREDTLDLAPGLESVFEPVSAALDTDTLRSLTARVSEDGEEPQAVARDWLVAEGLADPP